MIAKLLKNKHFLALYLDFLEVLNGCYPSFVWRGNVKETKGVPVFNFHSVTLKDFEAKLQFLKHNHYATVIADELSDYIIEGKKLPPKSIMLTLDDGRKSSWAIAYPLLKKYGYRATVFIIPKIVKEDYSLSPTLEDIWLGKVEEKALEKIDRGPHSTISWSEVKVMHNSGVIDFQSHSLDHSTIPVSSRVVDFLNPKQISEFYFEFNIPLMNDREFDISNFAEILGSPIYKRSPSLREKRMYLEDIKLREKCVNHVLQSSGRDFFKKKNWFKELMYLVKEYRRRYPNGDLFETSNDQENRILESLKKAKNMIENRIPDKKICHLCYPWGAGSQLSVDLSKQSGYVSNFWLRIPHRPSNNSGSNPYYIVRLKHDFIWRLPGEGRKSLKEVYLSKFIRRVRGKIDY